MATKTPIREPRSPHTEPDRNKRSWPKSPSDQPDQGDEADGHRGMPGINEPEMPADDVPPPPDKEPSSS